MPTINENQLHRLRKGVNALAVVLEEIEPERDPADLAGSPTIPEPKWVPEYRRMWRFLKDLEDAGGSVPSKKLSEMARRHGYNPRGLGGFFNGDAALAMDGDLRELTDAGRLFLSRYQDMFGPEAR